MVLDPERRRLVLFGGDYDWVFYYGGTWELTLEDGLRWNPLAPEGTAPSERSGGAFAFDQPADRLVMIGGETDHQPPGFVWALGFGPLEWTELHPSGQGPQWFSRGASILDPVGRRMILFGQYLTGVDEPTTWSLALKDPPEWRLLDVAGGPPRGAFKPAAVHDPARSRMLLFGGFDGKAYNELWQLTWDRPTPTILSLVSARAEAGRVELIWQASGAAGGVVLRSRNGADWSIVGAVSADGAGMLRFVDDGIAEGGHIGYRIDVRSQEGEPVSSETWLDVPVLWRLAVRGFQPNPAVGTPRVAFTVPARGQVTVEVLDVAGRTVLSQEFTIDEPGPQSATPAWSARVPAGVYWIKLRQGTDHVVKKGVVLR
jgi:hypothetical protein